MKNTETLKRLLKEPLDGNGEVTERIRQFLIGIFDAGKIVGYKQGYEAGKEDEQNVSKKGGQ